MRATFSSYSSLSINTPVTPTIICLKIEWTQKQISKNGEWSKDNPSLPYFVLCGSSFQKSTKLNWSPLQEQLKELSFLFSGFLLRVQISELSHIIWTTWSWFILMTLGSIYTKKRGTGQRPSRLNQYKKSILSTLFFPFSGRLFSLFPELLKWQGEVFILPFLWIYTRSVSWS